MGDKARLQAASYVLKTQCTVHCATLSQTLHSPFEKRSSALFSNRSQTLLENGTGARVASVPIRVAYGYDMKRVINAMKLRLVISHRRVIALGPATFRS